MSEYLLHLNKDAPFPCDGQCCGVDLPQEVVPFLHADAALVAVDPPEDFLVVVKSMRGYIHAHVIPVYHPYQDVLTG